jgi:polysaccharide export outer membrane protein
MKRLQMPFCSEIQPIRARYTMSFLSPGLWFALLCSATLPAQPPAVEDRTANAGYVLGPDDQIVIRAVEGFDLADKPVLIGANGSITLPMIGRVKAAGLTVEQLENELRTELKTYIKEPDIAITVTEFRSQPVSVFGAVNTPGVIQLRGRKTLYEVLSMAGGPRESTGSTVSITRRREYGDLPLPGAVPDPSGQFSKAQLDLQAVLGGGDPAADIEMKPYDVVSVAQANAKVVYVVGDVQHAGAFPLGPQKTVSVLAAMSLAGGLGRTAKPEQAKIFRHTNGESQHQEISVDVRRIMEGKAEDIGLRADDVLVVPTSGRKTFSTYTVPATIASAVAAAIYAGGRF